MGREALNRDALLPSREQIESGAGVAAAAKERLAGRCEVVFVKPDCFGRRPRAFMDGGARRFVHVAPNGLVSPCRAAALLPGLVFDDVNGRWLGDIWARSSASAAFRGEA